MSYRLPKTEILRKRGSFPCLFSSRNFVRIAPIQAYFSIIKNQRPELRAGFAVSRHYSRAVDRNQIKRLLRETYRLRRTALKETVTVGNMQLSILFLYFESRDQKSRRPSFSRVESSMKKVLETITTALAKTQ